jgi:type I phosphodiesterase/nucleotide pyrophosphatase
MTVLESRRALAATTAVLTAAGILTAVTSSTPGAAAAPPSAKRNPVVLFSADGMRPDLMQHYASQGQMPAYAALMRDGATGDNGLTQGFPPNTGQGWYTLATGAGPGVHGSTNNTFFDNRQPFTSSTSFSFHGNGAGPGTDPTNVLEAQSVASSAELAGRKVAQLEWTGGLNANINGPTVDYSTFYSTRGVLEYPANPVKQTSAASLGCPTRSPRSPRRPAGPTCRPRRSRPSRPC